MRQNITEIKEQIRDLIPAEELKGWNRTNIIAAIDIMCIKLSKKNLLKIQRVDLGDKICGSQLNIYDMNDNLIGYTMDIGRGLGDKNGQELEITPDLYKIIKENS